ncbi:hypothetical protein ABE083_16905 [Bacillus mycoides]|uniref:hypothetical protein n=1 Tax=Bacillus mycoides TaxID=1405 RepID=UPI003D1D4B22
MDRKTFVSLIAPNSKVAKTVNTNKSFKSKQFGYFTFDQMRLVEEGIISASTFTVLCWMVSKPKYWTFRKNYMYETFERRMVDKAFRELISAGHLVVVNNREGKKEELCVRVFAERQTPVAMKHYATCMIQHLRSQGKKNISVIEHQWNFFNSVPLEIDNEECTDWENMEKQPYQSTEKKDKPTVTTEEATIFGLLDGLELDEDNRSYLGLAINDGQYRYYDEDGRPTNSATVRMQPIEAGVVYNTSEFTQEVTQW